MRNGPTLALLSITVVFGWVFPVSAQDAGPQLTVRTAEGQTTFYIGQRIPLELSFTGPDNGRYEINTATSDSRDPIGHEKFEVASSPGWADPLETYFGSMMGYGGSFLSGFLKLSPKPFVINLDLNQWVRFDQPGNYTITIESRRVTDVTEKAPNPYQREPLTLLSNPIRLQIVSAPETWQREKLAAIVTQLNAPPPKPGMPPPDLKITAADLRFLGTAAAARVMAQHLREDDPAESQCMLGLVGLRESVRPAGLGAMNKLIAAPDFPVSNLFLNAMSVLQLTSSDPESQREERQKLTDADWILALQALPTKQGKARAATAQTLSNWQPGPFSAQQRAELARILGSSLKDLPVDQQASELQWNWDQLRDQISRSTLEQLAKIQPDDRRFDPSIRYSASNLKSIALQRWYELDPDAAHEEIPRQIGSPNPSLNADALSFLPDNEKLPQFEGLWAEQFIATDEPAREALFAGLLVRFGTGSAVGLVMEKENSKPGEGVCTLPDTALAYLLKFDAENARPLAEQAFKGASEGKSGCHFSFQNIARSVTSPILTELAVNAIGDPDTQVTNDALIYLMAYGDKSAEEPIWNRYVEWSEKWRGRADTLEGRQAGSMGGSPEIGVGENLALALIANQGWLATPDLIARVIEKCVGEQMCGQVKQLAGRANATPLSVSAYRSGPNENYEIAQYSAKSLELLEAKVAQFPRGTRFSLTETSPQNQDQKKLDDQVQALFEKNGMVLERPSSPGSQ